MNYLDLIRDRIGLPIGTRLAALFRGRGCWHVWTAVRDQSLPYSQWQGTYLSLQDDGSIDRVTIYDDGHEDIIHVKGSDT